jgi:hypothetical protein
MKCFSIFRSLFARFNLFGADAPTMGGIPRSPQWENTKKEYEKIKPKQCEVFGCKSARVQLHHFEPFATCPEKENDLGNLCWLCQGIGTNNHHIGWGHLGSFLSINLHLRAWLETARKRPRWNVDAKQWMRYENGLWMYLT